MPDLGTLCLLLVVILGALAAFVLGWISGCECGYQRGRFDEARWREDTDALANEIWQRQDLDERRN
jgi:ABC-type dipeptide/oligopeptide/nickel transport system permease subunit